MTVGENFRFGHRGTGDAALLPRGPAFPTRVVPLVEVDGEIVSSSHIRGLVAAGDVDAAARFLGHPFQLRGEVVRPATRAAGRSGTRRPTSCPTTRSLPGHGIYACRAGADGAVPAAVNVGVRPTFETAAGVLVEAYLLDFEGELYG